MNDDVFDALGDQTRRRLLHLLASSGGATATELAGHVPITRQAVVKHLGVLAQAGLVTSARAGREVRFELRTAPLEDARDWIDAVGRAWDARLGRLAERFRSSG
jgi:DNA-binding transcriptional ArsR family regulator